MIETVDVYYHDTAAPDVGAALNERIKAGLVPVKNFDVGDKTVVFWSKPQPKPTMNQVDLSQFIKKPQ